MRRLATGVIVAATGVAVTAAVLSAVPASGLTGHPPGRAAALDAATTQVALLPTGDVVRVSPNAG